MNPYEIETKRPTQLTEAEQVEKLHGYINTPAEYWPFIKYSTHIRYVKKNGEFKTGGFVLKNPFDITPTNQTTKKRFIKLQNGFYKTNADYKDWIVAYEDIEYIYAKCTGVELTLRNDIQAVTIGLNAHIQTLVEGYKKLEAKLSALERST